MNHLFRIDSIYRIQDSRVSLRPGEIKIAPDIDEQFVDSDDTNRPIIVGGVQPGDLAVCASFTGPDEYGSGSEPYFVTSTRKDSATIVPVRRIVREPGSYATGELKSKLLSVSEDELSDFGVEVLLRWLERHNLR